jgi:hypothetical protein
MEMGGRSAHEERERESVKSQPALPVLLSFVIAGILEEQLCIHGADVHAQGGHFVAELSNPASHSARVEAAIVQCQTESILCYGCSPPIWVAAGQREAEGDTHLSACCFRERSIVLMTHSSWNIATKYKSRVCQAQHTASQVSSILAIHALPHMHMCLFRPTSYRDIARLCV